VAHHALDPHRVCRSPPHDAGDLLDEAAHLRRVGARNVGVIEGGRVAETVGGSGEPAFVCRIVKAIEKIDLGMILLMHKGVGCLYPHGEAVTIGGAVEALAVGGSRGRKVVTPKISALVPGAALHTRRYPCSVIAGRCAIDAHRGTAEFFAFQSARGRGKWIPIVWLVTCRDGAGRLVEQCDLRLEGIAE